MTLNERFNDPFAPPGFLTRRGSTISIDSSNSISIRHGSRIVTIPLSPLQWKILAISLMSALASEPQKNPILIETEAGSLKVNRANLGVEITARHAAHVSIGLIKSEASELLWAARRRAPNHHLNKGATKDAS